MVRPISGGIILGGIGAGTKSRTICSTRRWLPQRPDGTGRRIPRNWWPPADAFVNYQIARWCIGQVKRTVPPITRLPGRPAAFSGDFQIPADLTAASTAKWARDVVADFRALVSAVIEPTAFDQILVDRAAQLTGAVLSTPETVLTWCSGKDLSPGLGTLAATNSPS